MPSRNAPIMELAAGIVAAFAGHNELTADKVPGLIRIVYHTLSTLGNDPTVDATPPAVDPKRSVFPDYIVCLEDGKKFKMLKRHLAAEYQMTPQQYRQKWSLPPSYPMVAANYAKSRSALAKKIGLGTKAAGSLPMARKATRKAPAKKKAAATVQEAVE